MEILRPSYSFLVEEPRGPEADTCSTATCSVTMTIGEDLDSVTTLYNFVDVDVVFGVSCLSRALFDIFIGEVVSLKTSLGEETIKTVLYLLLLAFAVLRIGGGNAILSSTNCTP